MRSLNQVQAAWTYLEPVFGAEDIVKEMPAEGNMFKIVDANWRKLMQRVVADTRVRVLFCFSGRNCEVLCSRFVPGPDDCGH